MMIIQRALLAMSLILCVLAVSAPADPLPGAQERMLADLKFLASDKLEGRGVDTGGINLAAERIRQEFADAGLDVSWDGNGYQEFRMVVGTRLHGSNRLSLVGPDGEQTLSLDEDFQTMSFGGSGQFEAPLVFCGYGIVSDDLTYNSFADIDVRGKVALIIRRTPQQGDEDGLFTSGHHGTFMKHAALTSKLRHAVNAGAVAVLFVNDPYSGRSEREKLIEQQARAEQRVIAAAESLVAGETPADETGDIAAESPAGSSGSDDPHAGNPHAANPHGENPHGNPHGGHTSLSPGVELSTAVSHLHQVRGLIEQYEADPLMEFGYGGRSRARAVPVMHVSQSAVDPILKSVLGKSLEQIEAEIDRTGRPMSAELQGWHGAGQTNMTVDRREVKNVIGVLPGEGPHAEETIVVGAHYDHVGRGGEGSLAPGSTEIHNGADDNASGTVALIELARMLAAREEPLPRRVMFIAFTGEERGLLGSAHYVKQPLVPLEKTIAMFNMDMVGRLTDDKLTVFGTGTATRWDEWIDREGKERNFAITKKPEGLGQSDHSSFFTKRIPVLHFFTGTHNDYHRPSDDWEKINIEGMSRIVDLLEELVVDTAATDAAPRYVAVKGKASIQPRSGARPYFGSIPDFGTEVEGYAIQGVSPDSPADKAGVQGGDVLIKLGKHPIGSLDDFDLALRTFSAGEAVKLVVLRDGKEVTLTVTLATPRQ